MRIFEWTGWGRDKWKTSTHVYISRDRGWLAPRKQEIINPNARECVELAQKLHCLSLMVELTFMNQAAVLSVGPFVTLCQTVITCSVNVYETVGHPHLLIASISLWTTATAQQQERNQIQIALLQDLGCRVCMCVTENETKSSRRLVSQSVGEISLVFLSFFFHAIQCLCFFLVFFRPIRTVNRRRSCILI